MLCSLLSQVDLVTYYLELINCVYILDDLKSMKRNLGIDTNYDSSGKYATRILFDVSM